MQNELFISALVIGFAGSLHCAGMCGPLMLTSLFRKEEKNIPTINWISYHTGRIAVYAIWGLLFGLIGTSIKLFGWQQNISLSLGVVILSIVTIITVFPKTESLFKNFFIFKLIQKYIYPFLQKRIQSSTFFAGIMNGMLPCGLVYIALAGATTMQNPLLGAIFMGIFGLSTLPMLYAVMLIGNRLQIQIRRYFTRWYPLMIGVMAILLILRGMNMGNFMSPSLWKSDNSKIHCSTG